ncbi:MAG: cell division protein FtsH, partial [Dehalococcoidia bacterium]|nr:cell division protein FtsH [Dehalococcoidia bacterium]
MTARGNIDTIEVKGDSLTILTTSGETLISRKESGSSIVEILQRGGVDLTTSNVEIISRGQSGLSSLLGVLFNFLPLIFFGAVLLFMMRSAQGNSN